MEKMIEVHYEGVVVARTAIVRELDTKGVFLGVAEPLPVGTTLSLRVGDGPTAAVARGKVQAVSEAAELSRAGMRIRFSEPGLAELFGTPVPAPLELEWPAEPVATLAAPGAGTTETTAPSDGARRSETASAGATAPAAPSPSVDSEAARQAAESAGPSRVGLEASSEKDDEPVGEGAGSPPAQDAGDGPAGHGARIPAPDPLAFGPGGDGGSGGKKGRRQKRR